MLVMQTPPDFPTYEYTCTVENVLFEAGTIVVKYLPTDTRFAAQTLHLPIWPDFDINDKMTYFAKFAPHDKWYAQEMILTHEAAIKG